MKLADEFLNAAQDAAAERGHDFLKHLIHILRKGLDDLAEHAVVSCRVTRDTEIFRLPLRQMILDFLNERIHDCPPS